MTNRNEIHNTSENENNTGNQINTGRVLVAAGALAAVAVGSGAAALLTSGSSTDDNQLDAVEDVVISDQSNVDGVRERVILTLNEPADLDFDDAHSQMTAGTGFEPMSGRGGRFTISTIPRGPRRCADSTWTSSWQGSGTLEPLPPRLSPGTCRSEPLHARHATQRHDDRVRCARS